MTLDLRDVRSERDDGSADAVVFDLDGVVYRGNQLLPGAAALIARLRAASVPVGFLTNGSTLDHAGVRRRLLAMGLDIGDAPVVTAVDALSHHLAARHPTGCTLLTIGTEALRSTLRSDGHRIAAHAADPDSIDAVAVGLDPAFGYRTGAAAAAAIQRGAEFVATNADRVRPTERGLQPETGAICAFLTAATGVVPTVVGKPSQLGFELVARALGVQPHRLLMVGDNLDTDVRGAHTVGAHSALVLTGVATAAAAHMANPPPSLTVANLDALDQALHRFGLARATLPRTRA